MVQLDINTLVLLQDRRSVQPNNPCMPCGRISNPGLNSFCYRRIAFCLCCIPSSQNAKGLDSFLIIDTHCIPKTLGGNGNGAIVQVSYLNEDISSASKTLSRWIKKRLIASRAGENTQCITLLNSSTPTSFMELNISVESDEELMEMVNNEITSLETRTTDNQQNPVYDGRQDGIGQKEQIMVDERYTRESDKCPAKIGKVDDKNEGIEQITVDERCSRKNNKRAAKIEKVDDKNAGEYDDVTEELELIWRGHLTKFGYSSFRPFQLRAIQEVEKGNDVIVIQGTGGGKSLCFQVPSLFEKDKVTLVISPTISLINSQVEFLQSRNIDAIKLGRCAAEKSIHNENRLFHNVGGNNLPRLAYMTPEYFDKMLHVFSSHKEKVKLIVFDEVHKVFDRNSSFRSCYGVLQDIRKYFTDTPVMALTATLSDETLTTIINILDKPKVIKGAVNRKNIKLNILKYDYKRSNKGKSSLLSWKPLASEIQKQIVDDYAIVYMDFKSEVKEMTECLMESGISDTATFFGQGMTHSQKSEIAKKFKNKEIQVLVATESYEVGTHNPHVNMVYRIGCMRNLSVLMQDFGRAGRDGTLSDGTLYINEYKDNQRLGYWTKQCSSEESEKIVANYTACWRWVYSLYAGRCLREDLLRHFGEDLDSTEATNKRDCCSSCDAELRMDFDIAPLARLLCKAIEELKEHSKFKNGVSELKLISWVRGSKQDWTAEDEIQIIIDKSETFAKGQTIESKNYGKQTWETVLRQCIHFELFDPIFNFIKATNFTRTYRLYNLSQKGKELLNSTKQILAVSPFVNPFEIRRNATSEKKQPSKRRNRGCHVIPNIRKMLKSKENWETITKRDDYEFPGFGTNAEKLYFCEDFKRSHLLPSREFTTCMKTTSYQEVGHKPKNIILKSPELVPK